MCASLTIHRRGNIYYSPWLPASSLGADSTNRVKGLPYPPAPCFLAFWLLIVGCSSWEGHLGGWRAGGSEVSIFHSSSRGSASAGGSSTGLVLRSFPSTLMEEGWELWVAVPALRVLVTSPMPCATANSALECVCVCVCDTHVMIFCSRSCV